MADNVLLEYSSKLNRLVEAEVIDSLSDKAIKGHARACLDAALYCVSDLENYCDEGYVAFALGPVRETVNYASKLFEMGEVAHTDKHKNIGYTRSLMALWSTVNIMEMLGREDYVMPLIPNISILTSGQRRSAEFDINNELYFPENVVYDDAIYAKMINLQVLYAQGLKEENYNLTNKSCKSMDLLRKFERKHDFNDFWELLLQLGHARLIED